MKTFLLLVLAAFAVLAGRAYDSGLVHGPRTLRGVVSFAERGRNDFFFKSDDGFCWRAGRESGVPGPTVGDLVEVSGEVYERTVNNRIDRCGITVLGHDERRIPSPEPVTIPQLYSHPVYGSGGIDRYARLVSVSGKVVDVNRRVDAVQIILSAGGKSASVSYKLPADTALAEGLAIGSVVRVTGVYVYTTEPQRAAHGEFTGISQQTVMLANPADLEVLTPPPFWTPLRVWTATGLALFVGFGLVFWVVSLRRTVARQVMVIEKALRERAVADGVRRERLRLSHDLHDDFQQLLAGTMFRISAAMNWLEDRDLAKVKLQLEKATASLVHTQSQLRAVLWGLHEESHGPYSLIGLFRYAAGRMAHWDGVVNITSSGSEPTLARTVAGALLMILQESVGNAIRHGEAKRVDVNVAFESDRLVMTIADDGKGFDAEELAHGLGLGSMEDRAKNLGGKLEVVSAPGQGTKITVEVPI